MAKKGKFDAILQGAVRQRVDTEEYIKKNISIREELKDFIPPLFGDEYQQLEQNILEEGCRDALILWKNENQYILVDGHNRYSICTTHRLDFRIEIRSFEGIEDVKDWMINNQLGKRNVTDTVKSYLRGQQYLLEKRKVGGTGANQHKKQLGQFVPTAQRLANHHKVSDKTIKRDAKYAESINKIVGDDKELKWRILNKEIEVTKGMIVEVADKGEDEIAFFKTQISTGNKVEEIIPPKVKERKKTSLTSLSEEEKLIQATKSLINKTFKELLEKKDKETIEKIKHYIAQLENIIFKG